MTTQQQIDDPGQWRVGDTFEGTYYGDIECTGIGEVTCRACRERSWMTWTEYYNHLADAALAWFAEHRGPRVVSTAEELDTLPVGSVVLDGLFDGTAWQCGAPGWWVSGESVLSSAGVMTDDGGGEVLPVTVLFTPTTESEGR